MGGYERNPVPWALDGIPADFNHRLLDPDWPRFERDHGGAIRRVPAIADAAVTRMINGPEGVHARQRVHPRRERGRRACSSPPASAPTGSRVPAASAARSRPGSSRASPSSTCGGWTSAASVAQYRSRAYTLARSVENYATYYDIHYPNEERQAGRPLRLSPAYRRLAALGAVFGEKASWERPNWFEPNAGGAGVATRPSSRRSGRAAGRARIWSPAIARRGAGDPGDGGAVRRDARSRRSRSPARRAGAAGVAVRQRRRPAGRAASPTRSCSTGAAASSATSP